VFLTAGVAMEQLVGAAKKVTEESTPKGDGESR
jgi:hypothetical protein